MHADKPQDRYWGESSPYDDLTTENLQDLTLKNAIADFVNFAKTVKLPFDTNHSSNADNAPWVFSGGSYSGALSAWTESTSPGTFWAYHASSAPVEAISDYVSLVVEDLLNTAHTSSGNTFIRSRKACQRTAARISVS